MPQTPTRVHLVDDYRRFLRLRDEIARQVRLTARERAAAADNRLVLQTTTSPRAPLQILAEVEWPVGGTRNDTPRLRWYAPQTVAAPSEGQKPVATQRHWQLSPAQKRALTSVLGQVTNKLRDQPVRGAADATVARNVLAMAVNRLAPLFPRDHAMKLAGWAVTVAINRLLSLSSGPHQRRRP